MNKDDLRLAVQVLSLLVTVLTLVLAFLKSIDVQSVGVVLFNQGFQSLLSLNKGV